MSVKIDKYVSIIDKSGMIGWIRDESNERVIIKINMDTKENTKKMLDMCLDALNTGDFETVNDESEDTPSIPADSNDESEGNNGAVEPDVNNDIGSDTGNTDGDDEDLNNG